MIKLSTINLTSYINNFIYSFIFGVWHIYAAIHLIPKLEESWIAIGSMAISVSSFILLWVCGKKNVRVFAAKWSIEINLVLNSLTLFFFWMALHNVYLYYIVLTITEILEATLFSTLWEDKRQIMFRGDERFQRDRITRMSVLAGGVIGSLFVLIFAPTMKEVIYLVMFLTVIGTVPDTLSIYLVDKYIKQEGFKYGFLE